MTLRVWLELLLHSEIFLLAVGELFALAKSAGPPFRHRFLVLVFALLTLLPAMTVIFPGIPLLLPSGLAESQAQVSIVEFPSRPVAAAARPGFNAFVLVWLLGVIATAAPLATGSFLIARLTRRATLFSKQPLPGVAILSSSELQIPFTCGVFRLRNSVTRCRRRLE